MTKILISEEMKNISGSRKNICAYSSTFFGEMICVDTPEEAEKNAGDGRWWACNTEEVKNHCNPSKK